ncbi:unnamed protein product [Paramecium sonneborni]|uniref:Uncharacterized protein n=1 Tax=Paramecium sonneborni TaxID=65129 RepID=A0A8S1RUD8_9CILI|nr:unnamed protein product [Paramecium sonneborni]
MNLNSLFLRLFNRLKQFKSLNYITDINLNQFENLLKIQFPIRSVFVLQLNKKQRQNCIHQGVLKNQYMKVIKLVQQKECVQMISEILYMPNSELFHFDLSY